MENNGNAQKGKGALDAFLNLFVLISLGWLSIAVGGILFNIINAVFKSTTLLGYGYDFSIQSGLKFGIASTIILLPVFLSVIAVLHKQYKKGTLSPTSGIHKWLTYLMLLASAITIIGSLVSLLLNFLNGEYTMNVVLKILVVLVLALLIFGYYMIDLRRKEYSKRSAVSMVAFFLVLAIGAGSVVAAFFFIDSPRVAKLKKFDMARVSDLGNMNSVIVSNYLDNGKLPEPGSQALAGYKDPETQAPYDYKVLGEKEYELCATFSVAVPSDQQSPGGDPWYNHLAGPQCFTKTVPENPDQVKPVPIR